MTNKQLNTRKATKAAEMPIIVEQSAMEEANKTYLDFVGCLNSIGTDISILERLNNLVKN